MDPSDVKYIVIHCSATPPDMCYPPEALERDHRRRGFRCAGYHYYILREGEIVPMRHTDEQGAHARGYNHCSIGICYEGGLDHAGHPSDSRTPAQKESLLRLLRILHQRFPQAEILGHRDLSPDKNGDGWISPNEWLKACPCFEVKEEYRALCEVTARCN